MAQLEANGIDIEYDTFGNPDHEPILLIMGLGTQMIAWSPEFCNALAERNHYVIRFDNRDIGLSTKFDHEPVPGRFGFFLNYALGMKIKAPYSLSDMAADAAGVLDGLDIEAAHIVGASMGGMIAQHLAFDHPARVLSLTSLMSTSGRPGLPKADSDVARHIFFTKPRSLDREVMIDHLVKSRKMIASPAYPRSDDEWRELVSISMERSFYPSGFGRQSAAIVADGSRARRLGRVRAPTLVIHGRDDPLVPVEHGIDTARHIKDARLEIIDGMGHDLAPPLVEQLTTLIADHAASAQANRENTRGKDEQLTV